MAIKILSVLMILIGAIFLSLSFPPARHIWKTVAGPVRRKWLIILYLMGFFIIGYLLYAIILISDLPFPTELVTGGVFLGGALFVYIIINLSQNTIAERQKAEEAIALAKDDWESTFDTVTDMITVHDMNYNIIRANPAATALFGPGLQEGTPSLKCFRCYHGAEQPPPECPSCKSLRTGEPSTLEIFEPHLGRYLEIRAMPRYGRDRRLAGLIHVVRDISARKQAEEALRKSEMRFQDLFQEAPVGYFEYGIDGNITDVNQTELDMLGYGRDEMIGQPVWTFLVDAETARRQILEKLAGAIQPFHGSERIYRRKDGSVFPVLIQDRLITDEKGHIAGIRCAIQDIAARKQAEEAIRESEVLYRTLADSGQALIWTSGSDKKCNYFNQTWLNFTGRTLDQEMGDGWAEGVHPEDLARCIAIYTGAFDRRERFSMPYRLRRHDGQYRWIQDDGSPRYDSRGTFLGYIGHCLDVTEQVRVNDSLRESEERYRRLVQSAPEAIFVQTEGRFAYLNPAAVRLFGAESADRLLGRPVLERFHPDFHHTVRERIRRLNDERQEVPLIEERCLRCDGTPFDIEASAVPIVHQGHSGALVFFHDITARKLAADALERTTEKLRKALGATVRSIATVVDIRDPYTAGHQKRVADLARAIAQEMGLTGDLVDGLRMAAVIHDIGKISVPAEILSKPVKLTGIEFSLIKVHPQSGYDILKDLDFPWPIARIVLEHHERIDGTGYPHGLSGEALLLESRILAVADVVEAMASHRPHRPALGIDAALGEIGQGKNVLYDAAAVEACLRLFREKGYRLTEVD